jgi:MFS transporter, DHA1 family, multidrug resistance protein
MDLLSKCRKFNFGADRSPPSDCSYVYFYLEPDIKNHGLRQQEHRLVPALYAVFLLPASMFWFGWTARHDIHWIVSIIGNMFYAMGAFIL